MKLYNVRTLDNYANDMGLFDSRYHSTYLNKANAEAFCKEQNLNNHLMDRVVKFFTAYRENCFATLMAKYNFKTFEELLDNDFMRHKIDEEAEAILEALDDRIEAKYPIMKKYQDMLYTKFGQNVSFYVEDIETVD